ncbi:MAG: hypothetical protein KZQ74_00500 [gamma proteobacterium symbiont of Bathyaustriella thionipta]|nr:hypothetical protein [gamma proteobacterium symbiont of Bathyaustriella thionipta]MCU7965689.1 hypothetical protein [gamma proteobacterium symbiont of Bathyaustriella thionipta]
MADNLCGDDKLLVKHEININNYEIKEIEGNKRWGIDKLYSSTSKEPVKPEHPLYGKNIKEIVYCDKRYNFNKCDEYSVWYSPKELINYESNGREVICYTIEEATQNNKELSSHHSGIFFYTKKRDTASPVTINAQKDY